MITKFKIFESRNIQEELINYVDFDLVEEIYDREYSIDEDELAYICSGCVVNNFDFDKFKEDFIYDMRYDRSYEDYDEHEYKEFIKSHLTAEKKEKIIDLYNDNNYDDEDDEDSEEVTEFDIDYLDDLDDSQLIEVIEADSDLDDFVKYIVNQYYNDYSGEEIFSEFYGMSEESIKRDNKNSYSYNRPKYETFGYYLWKEYNHYIDRQGMVDDWKSGEDDTSKKEYVANYIYNTPALQKNIIANDPDNILDLFELFANEPDGRNIANQYKYQKLYMDKYLEYNGDEDDEEDKDEYYPEALKFLHDNFGLNKDIEKEYNKYTILIDKEKYNL